MVESITSEISWRITGNKDREQASDVFALVNFATAILDDLNNCPDEGTRGGPVARPA